MKEQGVVVAVADRTSDAHSLNIITGSGRIWRSQFGLMR